MRTTTARTSIFVGAALILPCCIAACSGDTTTVAEDDAGTANDASVTNDVTIPSDASDAGESLDARARRDGGRRDGGGFDGGRRDGGRDGAAEDAGEEDAGFDAGEDAGVDSGPTYTFANPLQVDLSSVFTADTVATTAANGEAYPPLTAMDGSGYDFFTVSAGSAGGDASGLPDNGQLAANADHPFAQLAFNNASTAANSIILGAPSTPLTVTFPVPAGTYNAFQIYATSTEGASSCTITLHHNDGSSSAETFTLPDWGNPGAASAPVFVAENGLGRFSAIEFEFNDAFALYGAAFATPGSTDIVTSVTVTTNSVGPRVVVYGVTGY